MPPQLLVGLEDTENFKKTHDKSSTHIYTHADILVKYYNALLTDEDIRRLKTAVVNDLKYGNFDQKINHELAQCHVLLQKIEAGLIARLDVTADNFNVAKILGK